MELKKRIKIDDKVYTKNVTCFLVDGEWKPNTQVSLDNYTKKHNLKTKLTECYDVEKNDIVFSSKPVSLYIYGKTIWVCKSLVENNSEFIEDPNYEPNSEKYISIFDKRVNNSGKYKPATKIYNISSYDVVLPKYAKISNALDFIDYSFGFELETNRGEIRKSYSDALGFASLYDGSISGVEYVSNPMSYNNLHYLHKFLKVAKTATDIDKYCSLHIHIGKVPKSDKNLLSMYLLFQRLTDELNQLIVPYKKDVKFLFDKLQNTGKDHCKNLPKLPQKSVEEIYKLFKINKIEKNNLSDYIETTSKWNVDGRYYSVNFMNYICKETNNTVEIRSLQSTYNFDYIVTWLLINCSIIHYAITYPDIVVNSKVKIELDDCIDEYVKDSKILSTLKQNIVELKNLFYNMYYLRGNSLTNLEIVESEITSVIKPYELYDVKDNYTDSFFRKYLNIKNNKSAKVTIDEPPNEEISVSFSQYMDANSNPINVALDNALSNLRRGSTYTISADGVSFGTRMGSTGNSGIQGSTGGDPDFEPIENSDPRRLLPFGNIDSRRYFQVRSAVSLRGLVISTFSNSYDATNFNCKFRLVCDNSIRISRLEVLSNNNSLLFRVPMYNNSASISLIDDVELRNFVIALINKIRTDYNLRTASNMNIQPEYLHKDQTGSVWLLVNLNRGFVERVAVQIINYDPSRQPQ
jgi:hypothetical protein